MNDRALRNLVVGLGGPAHGVPRESGFEITVASEIMAVLCLASDLADLKTRVARMIVGERADGTFITAGELNVAGAAAVLLRDALKPNLVQTLEGTPAFVHGGPFANIAHGCNSLMATRVALKLAEVVVTEAGFATELGAEKFFDIKCRAGGLTPSAAVIVATVRALKMHGGVAREQLAAENVAAVRAGLANLEKHVENVRHFGVPPVVALNHFTADSDAEVAAVMEACTRLGVPARLSRVWERGGDGGSELAQAVLAAIGTGSGFHLSTRTPCRYARRSRPSPRRSTAPPALPCCPPRPPSWRSTRPWAMVICPCAWRRRRTRSRTIRRSWAGPATSP